MLPSFSNLLDRLKGLFSQDFLLVGLFPTLLFSVLSAAWTYWSWPSTRSALDALLQQPPTRQLPYWLAGLMVLVVFAFVIWSLNPVMRRFLEGELLPAGLRRLFESQQQREWLRLDGRRRELWRDLFALRKAMMGSPTWRERLRDARPPQGHVQDPAYRVPQPLLNELERLKDLRASRALIPFPRLQALFEPLLAELRQNSANAVRQLDDLKIGLNELVGYARDRVENEHDRLVATIQAQFPAEAVRLAPSRMGNVGQLHREYCWLRYAIDVEELWPRLLKIARADPSFYPVLEGAKTQLDFAVVMSFVSTLFTAVWSVLTLCFAPGLAPYLTIVLVGPLAIFVFYRLAVANYQAFGEAVRSAVDLFRFDLLRALHLALPLNEDAERELWRRVAKPPSPQRLPLTYRHP